MTGFLTAAALWALTMPVWSETVIHAGRLIDVDAGRVLTGQSIVVDGERIVRVESGYVDGETIIDLRDATVMPGWIDMHVHIASEQAPERQLERFTLDPQDAAYRSVVYAERTLMAGFTTVRDLGTGHGLAQSLRRAVDQGLLPEPRIFTAGKSIATTGGHADPSNGTNRELARDPGPDEGVVNSVDDAWKAVRARYQEGADLVKITATGGVLSQARSGENPQFRVAEIDSIEHGTFMTDEVIRLMRRHGTWYVPTISAGRFVGEKAEEPGYFSELVRPKAAAIGPQIQDIFARAYRGGVKIAFGTDTGVSPHGDNWREFGFMIEAGMPAMEAIQSATKSAAELLGESERLGSIETGKLADSIAVPGDSLTDSQAFGRVHFVMKGGSIYKSPWATGVLSGG